ncbi:MAG: hypothetical protein GY909_01425 [Oligoflexia bacterium]|nr:hypothetical protein [Oligoflexia bacterium]
MKSLTIILTLFMSMSLFAQNRNRQETRALKLIDNITRNANEVRYLDDMALRSLLQNLRQAKSILDGGAPGPVPPRPRPIAVCSQNRNGDYHATFSKIKSFAYSTSGIDLSSSESTQYAGEWTNTYPCHVADEFITNFKRLKKFAYSTSGLDMSSSESVQYAKNKIERFCSSYELEAEFKRHYQFAYSTGGLDLSASESREYAINQVDRFAFTCRNFR